VFKNILYIKKKHLQPNTHVLKKITTLKINEKEEKPSPKYIGIFHVKFFFLQAILNPRLKNKKKKKKKNPTP